MTEQDVERLAELARIYIYMHAPYDTGNLRQNSLKLTRVGDKSWRIFIDLKIAPYQVYLNEKQEKFYKNKPGGEWQAKRNRHYKWWQKTIQGLVMYLQDVAEKDIDDELRKAKNDLKKYQEAKKK